MQNKSSLFSASRLFMIFPILAFASHSLPYSWRFCGGALVSVSWRTARFSIALPLSVPLLPSPRLECFYPHGESLCIPQNHTHMLPSIGSLSWALSQNELLASLYFLDSFFLYLFTTRHNLSSLSSQGSALRPRPYSQACNRAGALDDDAPPPPRCSRAVRCDCACSVHQMALYLFLFPEIPKEGWMPGAEWTLPKGLWNRVDLVSRWNALTLFTVIFII